jgi:hypothetical protein
VSAWRDQVLARREEASAHLRRAQAGGARAEVLHAALAETGAMVDAVTARVPATVLQALTADLLRRVCAECTHGRWDARSATRWVVLELLPGIAPVLAADVTGVVDDLVAAATRLRGQVDLRAWAARLTRALTVAGSVEDLHPLAALAAWRSGGVRWRAAALRAAGEVPARSLAAAVGLDDAGPGGAGGASLADGRGPDPHATLERNAREPWWWPGTSPGVWRVGGFRGFGGPWIRLPVLIGGDGERWLVRTETAAGDGGASTVDAPAWRWWLVRADRHGWSVLPTTSAEDIASEWFASPERLKERGARAWTSPRSYHLHVAGPRR